MATIDFFKYQGAGNDFVIVRPEFNKAVKDKTVLIERLCDRRFGIGADGLILWEKGQEEGEDFRMVYYNSDGRESTLCGNGGRCIAAFAFQVQELSESMQFTAIDGPHEAEVEEQSPGNYWVRLQMPDVKEVKSMEKGVWMDTGSPHHVEFVENLATYPVDDRGREIRNSYGTAGSNVNFIAFDSQGELGIRTYERGVEGETLACGTGVTAAALAAFQQGLTSKNKIDLQAQGGKLQVEFDPIDGGFKNVWLSGPANFVFKGSIDLEKL